MKKSIKRGAHATTLLAVCWTLFSAFGVFDWFDARRTWGDPNAIPDFVIWGIHLLLISIAAYAWRNETPRETLWLGGDEEVPEENVQELTLGQKRERLKRQIVWDIVSALDLIFFAVTNKYFSSSPGSSHWLTYVMGSLIALMVLQILHRSLLYVLYWRSEKIEGREH